MAVVHLTNDEKFIDGFIKNQHELFPDIPNFYFARSKNGKFQHIKAQNVLPISISQGYDYIRQQLPTEPEVLIIHGLNPWKIDVLFTFPDHVKVVWIFYGFEVFNRGENIKQFVGKQTWSIAHGSVKERWKIAARTAQYWLAKLGLVSKKLTPFQAALKRINYFAHWIKEDFEYLSSRYPMHNMEYLEFSYGNPVLTFDLDAKGNDLMIGNSAADTNNHADIINELTPELVNNFNRVIIPLSYSGTPSYVNSISKLAKEKFGDKAMLLTDFMSKEDYFNLLKNVRLAIMGQLRSQGAANIRFFLVNKIDIAMFESNNLYRHYISKGLAIHSIAELRNTPINMFSESELEQNRKQEEVIHGVNARNTYYSNLFHLITLTD